MTNLLELFSPVSTVEIISTVLPDADYFALRLHGSAGIKFFRHLGTTDAVIDVIKSKLHEDGFDTIEKVPGFETK
jgi:hypothetical protein